MKQKYFSKMAFYVLILSTCMVSCDDREREREPDREMEMVREQIMDEIERLDRIRKKVGEFVAEREVAIKAKEREYDEWEENILERLTRRDRSSKTFSSTRREWDEGSMVFLKKIVTMELDMKNAQATRDSLNDRYRREVAKFGREM